MYPIIENKLYCNKIGYTNYSLVLPFYLAILKCKFIVAVPACREFVNTNVHRETKTLFKPILNSLLVFFIDRGDE